MIKHVGDGCFECVGGVVVAYGYVPMLDVALERLNGVECGRLRRRIEVGDARRGQGREHLRDDGAALHRVVGQHDHAGAVPPIARSRRSGATGNSATARQRTAGKAALSILLVRD